MKPNIAILILFYNKVAETIECIDSFLPGGQHIYILNNGSESSSVQKIERRYSDDDKVHLIDFNENLGPAKGRNKLVSDSTEEWLFFIDNDITIQPQKNWVEIFWACQSANAEAKVFCPQLYNVYEKQIVKHPLFILNSGKIFLEPSRAAFGNYFPSGASIVHRSIFDTYGLFDDALFAFEDYEYAIRLLTKGIELKVVTVEGITLMHDHKYQKADVDKAAVKARYNEEKLQHSFNHMQAEHNVVFEHDWEWWSRKQVSDMTADPIFKKIKSGLKRLIGK